MTEKQENKLAIYQSESGAIELRADSQDETIWATQKEIANIFDIDRTVVNRHIRNIFKDDELDEKVVCAKFAHTTKHGALANKIQTREQNFYNLDIILAVGYRTSSSKAIDFRKWATQTLKQHITQGFTVNSKLLAENYNLFLKALDDVKALANNAINTDEAIELIKTFSSTWFSLQSYDEQKYPKPKNDAEVDISIDKLYNNLAELKSNLIVKGEATPLFAQEKSKNSLESIVNNVMQEVFGEKMYSTIEEKAAHLLYFIVKNHPFNDGNKRSGAFAFIWFLNEVGYKHKITPETLTTLTILIAESSPKDKDKMVGMILLLLIDQSLTTTHN